MHRPGLESDIAAEIRSLQGLPGNHLCVSADTVRLWGRCGQSWREGCARSGGGHGRRMRLRSGKKKVGRRQLGRPTRHGNLESKTISGAGVALHPQAGSAMADMSNDGGPAVNLGDTAQIDGKRQLYQRALRKSKVRGFDEDAIRAQVPGPAQLAFAARHVQVDRGTGTMPSVQTPFHREDPARSHCWIMTLTAGTVCRQPGDKVKGL